MINIHISYYCTNNTEYLYIQNNGILYVTILNICFWKAFTMQTKCHTISMITLSFCTYCCILFASIRFLQKRHPNRWLILKVLPHAIKVSLSRWTLGFRANIGPLPYGQEDLWQKHYVQFCTSTQIIFDPLSAIICFCGQGIKKQQTV